MISRLLFSFRKYRGSTLVNKGEDIKGIILKGILEQKDLVNEKTKNWKRFHSLLYKNFQGFLVYRKLRSYLSIAKSSNENDDYTIKALSRSNSRS